MRPARRVFLKRVLPAAVCFAAAEVHVERTHDWDLRGWIVERGEAAGCAVFRSGRYLVGERGPFFGDDLKHDAWNLAWRHGPLALSSVVGLVAAGCAYGVCAGPLGRTRVFGYRVATRCGGCGYALAGLREARCPECGRVI